MTSRGQAPWYSQPYSRLALPCRRTTSSEPVETGTSLRMGLPERVPDTQVEMQQPQSRQLRILRALLGARNKAFWTSCITQSRSQRSDAAELL